jgi:hypothetical protein
MDKGENLTIGEELLDQLQNLTIDQMFDLVKRSGNTQNRRFKMKGPKATVEGEIYDVYLGVFSIDGQKNFFLTRDFRFLNDIKYELI